MMTLLISVVSQCGNPSILKDLCFVKHVLSNDVGQGKNNKKKKKKHQHHLILDNSVILTQPTTQAYLKGFMLLHDSWHDCKKKACAKESCQRSA